MRRLQERMAASTYRSLGGVALGPGEVEAAIRSCYRRMAADYEDPAKYDDFPQVAEVLRAVAPICPRARQTCWTGRSPPTSWAASPTPTPTSSADWRARTGWASSPTSGPAKSPGWPS